RYWPMVGAGRGSPILQPQLRGYRVASVHETQQPVLPVLRIIDADPPGSYDSRPVVRIGGEKDLVGGQNQPVFGPFDPEAPGQLSRPRKVRRPAVERFGRAYKNSMGLAGHAGDDVEHPVHSVNEIHVSVAGRTEHDLRADSAAPGRVGGEVARAEVG